MRTTRSKALASDAFLRTRECPVPQDLLPSHDDVTPEIGDVSVQDGKMVAVVEGLLSEAECAQIVNLQPPTSYRSLNGKYEVSKRKGSRLLVLDEALASLLWKRLEPILTSAVATHNVSVVPLGFNVLGRGGQWRLHGINPAMRVNIQESGNGFFAPHYDAQFCQSGEMRSVFSVIVYLNDGFESGGETVFWRPKGDKAEVDVKGFTIDEEIEARGGEAAFEKLVVVPKTGRAVVFGHDVMHQGKGFEDEDIRVRYVLRTDVVVTREGGSMGFVVSEEEAPDYRLCLSYFREAQHKELEKAVKKAGELYERSLSIRYAYPRVLQRSRKSVTTRQLDFISRLPAEIQEHLVSFFDYNSVQRLVLAFPHLLWLQEYSYFLRQRVIGSSPAYQKLLSVANGGGSGYSSSYAVYCKFGRSCWIEFNDSDFFEANVEGCCRAAAIIAFFQLGQRLDAEVAPVAFDPVTQTVKAVEMEQLVTAAFLGEACYGSVFAVEKGDETTVEEDFDNAVDRTFMTYRFGTEFVGKDYLRNFNHHVTVDPAYLEKRGCKPLPPDPYVGIDGFTEATPWVAFQPWMPTPLDWSIAASYARFAEPLRAQEKGSWYLPAMGTLAIPTPLHASDSTGKTRVKGKRPPGGATNYLHGVTASPRGREFTSVVEAHGVVQPCLCDPVDQDPPKNITVRHINNLVFDFSRHELKVTPEDAKFSPGFPEQTCASCAAQTARAPLSGAPISNAAEITGLRYRVDIAPLQHAVEPFFHASARCTCWNHKLLPHCFCKNLGRPCRCNWPKMEVDAMDCLGYQHMDHVHLVCKFDEEEGKVSVLAIYGGIVAL
ncbi:hypothetical protein HDU96_010560 [Phlyctochytrium bullatum]|nr:hypothetical protein HDU96_010560 [Phlyctochytrium bullatum]